MYKLSYKENARHNAEDVEGDFSTVEEAKKVAQDLLDCSYIEFAIFTIKKDEKVVETFHLFRKSCNAVKLAIMNVVGYYVYSYGAFESNREDEYFALKDKLSKKDFVKDYMYNVFDLELSEEEIQKAVDFIEHEEEMEPAIKYHVFQSL